MHMYFCMVVQAHIRKTHSPLKIGTYGSNLTLLKYDPWVYDPLSCMDLLL